MKSVVRASGYLHRALRVAAVVVPALAVVIALASGSHVQPDLGKWY